MKKKSAHKDIETFITLIRESFHDSVIVYRLGGCYGLYRILKHVFPEAEAYFQQGDKRDHIITKIENRFYEIKGESFQCKGCPDCKAPQKLTKEDHSYWRKVSYGQRLEEMLSKYRESVS